VRFRLDGRAAVENWLKEIADVLARHIDEPLAPDLRDHVAIEIFQVLLPGPLLRLGVFLDIGSGQLRYGFSPLGKLLALARRVEALARLRMCIPREVAGALKANFVHQSKFHPALHAVVAVDEDPRSRALVGDSDTEPRRLTSGIEIVNLTRGRNRQRPDASIGEILNRHHHLVRSLIGTT